MVTSVFSLLARTGMGLVIAAFIILCNLVGCEPKKILPPADCTGSWPGPECPTELRVGKVCTQDTDCPTHLTCSSEVNGWRFCTMPCEVVHTPGRRDECAIHGGTCIRYSPQLPAFCVPRCALPSYGLDGSDHPREATCALGTCSRVPTEPPDSRLGICYPHR